MPLLSRVRFVSVGHPQARMHDLLLDLRDRGGAPTDSTIWLRNGGGKSSILNLLFAIVRPSRREFLGGRADSRQRRLDDYVLPGDRSLTAAEWQLDSGELAVTGVFYERRPGDQAGALKRLFFAVRVDPARPETTLEGLPIDTELAGGGRGRRTMVAFRQAWQALGDTWVTDSQRSWQDVLEHLGIDAGVFSYQIRMNQREGGADELFRFSGPEDFVDFLLELALDPELGDQIGRNVATFRQELLRRKRQLVPERELVAGLIQRVSPLAGMAEERAALAAALAGSRTEAAAIGAWLDAERRRVERSAAASEERSRSSTAAAGRLTAEAEAAEADAAALTRHAAALRAAAARAALDRIRRELAEARREALVRDACVPLRDARRFERRARELRDQLDTRRVDSTPLREQLASAASAYAAALVHRVDTLRAEAADRAEQEARAEACARDLAARIADARELAARSEERARLLSARIADAEAARRRVEESGALGSGEPSAAAIRRLEADIDERGRAIRALRPNLDRLEEQLAAMDRQLERDHAAAAAADAAWRLARGELERAEAARAELEGDPTLLAALELEALDLDSADEALQGALARVVRRAQERILELKLARADDERAVAHLERSGLLPPSADVEALLRALGDRVRARSGWAWLEAEVPAEQRAERLRAAPAAACGLIVHPQDFDRALTLLADRPPEGPVLLATPAAFDSAPPGPRAVLGPADASRYDRDSGRTALEERRRRLEAAGADIAAATESYRALAGLLEQLSAFRAAHPRGWFTGRREAVRALEAAASSARAAAEARAARRIELQLSAGAERERILELRRHRDRARRLLERVRAYAEDHERELATWRRELAEACSTPASGGAAIEGWRREAEAARAAAREAAERARACEAEAREASARLRAIRHLDGAAPSAAPGDVEALCDSYRQLCRACEDAPGAEGLAQAARENERHARRSRAALTRLLSDGLSEAEVASALDALADPADAERARREASARVAALEGRAGALEQGALQRERALEAAEQHCRQLNRPGRDLELPDSAEAAETRAEELQAEVRFLRGEISRLESAAREAREARRAAAAALDLLSADQRRLEGLRAVSSDLPVEAAGLQQTDAAPPADRAEARRRLDALEAALAELRGRLTELERQRREAASALRAWVGSRRFKELDSPLVRRFRELSEGDLERCASDFSGRLSLRLEQLDALLSDADRHREVLISQLLGLAEEGLSLLRAASSSSRLPDHLPGLGGAHFLKISTHPPADTAERRAIVAQLVDDLVESEHFPAGSELVQRAVRRLARPIRVRVLHPDPALSQRVVEIAEVARFSGGEQLTCAILLYCTLARLRARSRGQREQPTSVLVLDNPVGRASRVRFLELQREVARAMGIQLIYTTGVNDHEALRTLPNLIRLRNARVDCDRGHRLIEEQPAGLITAARVARVEPDRAPATLRLTGTDCA